LGEQTIQPLYLIVIDPSLNSTGWAVFSIAAKPKLINYGYIDNNHYDTDKLGNKMIHLEMALQTIKFAYQPAYIVKEDWVPPNGSGKFGISKTTADTAYKLAAIHGTVEKVFSTHNIAGMNNKTFKKGFTGNGNAEKDEVAEWVQKYRTRIWSPTRPLVIRRDDESDAIGIGIYWLILNERIKKLEVDKK
jgi:Holliday junction resolvasome RuvABC endonuclease subunit